MLAWFWMIFQIFAVAQLLLWYVLSWLGLWFTFFSSLSLSLTLFFLLISALPFFYFLFKLFIFISMFHTCISKLTWNIYYTTLYILRIFEDAFHYVSILFFSAFHPIIICDRFSFLWLFYKVNLSKICIPWRLPVFSNLLWFLLECYNCKLLFTFISAHF